MIGNSQTVKLLKAYQRGKKYTQKGTTFFFTAEFSHFLMTNFGEKGFFPQKFVIKKVTKFCSKSKKCLFDSEFSN
jgi:hypothetical protein